MRSDSSVFNNDGQSEEKSTHGDNTGSDLSL